MRQLWQQMPMDIICWVDNIMLDTIVTAVLSFISTNLDDIFILMLLFAQATRKSEIVKITLGQYLGITVLMCISTVGALAAKAVPQAYIRFLGLVPIALGVKAWWGNRKGAGEADTIGIAEVSGKERIDSEESKEPSSNHMLYIISVTSLTIANGADNIGIYIPVFSQFSILDMLILIVVFTIMTGIWCFVGYRLASLPVIRNLIRKYQYVLVPVVLIGLGIYILS